MGGGAFVGAPLNGTAEIAYFTLPEFMHRNWYNPKLVFGEASAALGGRDIDALLQDIGRSIGPPWQVKQKLATAAALAATAR